MRFMKDDEFLLLMVHAEDRAVGFEKWHILTTEERKRLYDVGIRTAHEQPPWNKVNPSREHYDWGYLDHMIGRNRNAGLKSLIQLPGWRVPKWVPQEWKARRKEGMYEDEALSFWSVEAQQYIDEYIQTVMDHYPEEDVGFFFGEHQGGEGAYPPTWCVFDDSALENYKNTFGSSAIPEIGNPDSMSWFGDKVVQHYIDRARLFYLRQGEAWNAQQRLMDKWSKAYGNFVQPDIMETYSKVYPDISVVLLQYTYFDDSHGADEQNWVDNLIKISNCETIVEAMFCDGLPKTTPLAIAKGFRGQIVHPANGFDNVSLSDDMVNKIRDSHNLWKASRE